MYIVQIIQAQVSIDRLNSKITSFKHHMLWISPLGFGQTFGRNLLQLRLLNLIQEQSWRCWIHVLNSAQESLRSSFANISLINRIEEINAILRDNVRPGDRFSVLSHVVFFARNSPGTARRILSLNLDCLKFSDVFGVYR